jgi:Ser/Thr protein kinase RdoA (MazF antagonist)
VPVTDQDLRTTLESVLGCRVPTISRRPNGYCSSFAIEDIEATLDDGQILPVVFKDLAQSALSPAARGAKPAGLLDPGREIEAYLDVLGPARIDVPTCYGAVMEPAKGRYWLFLESIDGVPLWQVSGRSAWEEAAAWLADLHTLKAPARYSHLLRYDATYFQRWIDRAVAFTPAGSLGVVAAAWPDAVERLLDWPRAFIHGEFYPSNVVIRAGTAGPRVAPVDWEMSGLGPGLLDLAALTSGNWTAADRERLALAYRDSLPSPGRPSTDELSETLAYFRLYIAVQWLGWSRDWSPPAEHAHDWLSEALTLAEELEL